MSTMYSVISRSFMSTSRTETQHFQTLAERFQERAMQGFWKRISYWLEEGAEHWRGADVPARPLILVVTVYRHDKVTSGRKWVRSVGCPVVC